MKQKPETLKFSYNNSRPVTIKFYKIGQEVYMSTEDIIPALKSTQLITVGIIALKSDFLKDFTIQYKNEQRTTHYYLDFIGFISFISMVIELKTYNIKRLIALRNAVIEYVKKTYWEDLNALADHCFEEGKSSMNSEIKETANA